MNRLRRAANSVLAVALGVGLASCDGTSTGPRGGEAPIQLVATSTGGPTGGDGYRVVTDYCGCVSSTLTLIDGRRNLTRIECTGVYGLQSAGGDEPVEATILGPGWRVSTSQRVFSSPHIGLRVDATCREP